MKLSATILLLFIASYALAQTPNQSSGNTKIDESEKKRLEKKFKTSDNFYIDDDGLVVYRTKKTTTAESKSTDSVDSTRTVTSVKSSASCAAPVQKSSNTTGTRASYAIADAEDSDVAPARQPSQPNKVVSSSVTPASTQQTVLPAGVPATSTVIRKEALKESNINDNTDAVNRNQPTTTKSTAVKSTPVTSSSVNQQTNSSLPTQSQVSSRKSSTLRRNNRPVQYKTMEEAALAVESLLDELRREQAQANNVGSMSSRLSSGAGRASLRKKTLDNSLYSDDATVDAEYIQEQAAFGYEPSYFINGKEVDRLDVNKLRRTEIISREVRTRNTVTGNPNGEIWFEVKYVK